MKKTKNPIQFRPTYAKIDFNALYANYCEVRRLIGPDCSMMGVVKANAYGHGAVEVSCKLESWGVEALAVASPEEALTLREAGIKRPIILLSGFYSASADFLYEYQLTPVLISLEHVHALGQALKHPLDCYLKVDTGMHRLGVASAELDECLRALSRYPRLQVLGVMSHLACADETLAGVTQTQLDVFAQVQEICQQKKLHFVQSHIANSAAIVASRVSPYHWVRPGIMLYGAQPSALVKNPALKPVMSLETEIISLRKLKVGDAVSYCGTWKAEVPSTIAVLALGYADGISRHLSNCGQVLLYGDDFSAFAPIVGRVCMDLTLVDVTHIPAARCGTRVQIWGPQNPIEENASRAGTISYELLCGVSARVPRYYFENGQRIPHQPWKL